VTGSSILRALAELLTESYAEEPPTDARRDWLREIVGNARDELDALRKCKPSDAWLVDVRALARNAMTMAKGGPEDVTDSVLCAQATLARRILAALPGEEKPHD
jgi:hypothetical protein